MLYESRKPKRDNQNASDKDKKDKDKGSKDEEGQKKSRQS